MSKTKYKFKTISPKEFTVENHRIYEDGNGRWIANPPVVKTDLQKEIHKHINNLKSQ